MSNTHHTNNTDQLCENEIQRATEGWHTFTKSAALSMMGITVVVFGLAVAFL